MKFKLTQHAQDAIKEREISEEWIARILNLSEMTEPDHLDDDLEHYLGKIKEYGNRVLRVIINKGTKPVQVVTAYFDRKMKGKL